MLLLLAFVGSCSSKLEKMPSIPEEPEQVEMETECFTMPDFLKPLHNLDVVESKEAVLECQVAGLPYPSITWFHNGSRIDSTDDRKMMQCKAPYHASHLLGVPSTRVEEGGHPERRHHPPRPSCHVRQGGELCTAWLSESYQHLLSPPDKDIHRLVFTSVSHAHAGVYKSVIANKVGKATCYAHLYVTGEQQQAPPGMCGCSLPPCQAVPQGWGQ